MANDHRSRHQGLPARSHQPPTKTAPPEATGHNATSINRLRKEPLSILAAHVAGDPKETRATMEPRIVHVDDNISGAVYIGRAVPRKGLNASPFANPYKIGDTDMLMHPLTRDDVIGLYHMHLTHTPELLRQLPALRNAPALACWCRHDGEGLTRDSECHGDVIVRVLATRTDDELLELADYLDSPDDVQPWKHPARPDLPVSLDGAA